MRSIFWASGVSAMRWMPVGASLIGSRISASRQGCRVPGPNTQCGWKRRRVVDIGRQSVEIDAADIREIARRQRAGDRLGGVPPFQRAGRAPGVFLGVAAFAIAG